MPCWKIGIVKVKATLPFIVSVPLSILSVSEYSAVPVRSKLGFLVFFSLSNSISLFWISFFINSSDKLLLSAFFSISFKLRLILIFITLSKSIASKPTIRLKLFSPID